MDQKPEDGVRGTGYGVRVEEGTWASLNIWGSHFPGNSKRNSKGSKQFRASITSGRHSRDRDGTDEISEMGKNQFPLFKNGNTKLN